MFGNSALDWGTWETPRPRISRRGRRWIGSPSQVISPSRGEQQAAHRLEHRRLAGAVRADDARHGAGATVDVDALEHVAAAVAGRRRPCSRSIDSLGDHLSSGLLEHEVVAEVGVDDRRVPLDLRRRARGHRRARGRARGPVAQAQHERHVVLDDQERLPVGVELADHLAHPLDQHRVDAAGRLVEQDQLRVEHQDLRELDELLLAVGQRPARWSRKARMPDELQQLLGRPASAPLTAMCASCDDREAPAATATTFSSTVISRNSRVIWNVRPSPRCARAQDDRPSIRSPAQPDLAGRRRGHRVVDEVEHASSCPTRSVRSGR